MADLIAVAFDDESKAFDMRGELVRMQKDYLLDMEDVVVVTRNDEGKVKLHQAVNLTAAGAVGGSFWGLLIGLLFLNPLLGLAVGAGAGAIGGALSDIGIDDDFMKELGEKLTPGSSALFVLVRKATGDRVIERLREVDAEGRILRTSLSKEDEATLREVLERTRDKVA
ncbi:DUF1269 domain-containing protein [Rhodovulum sp. BSW8]|uniref:DUF1269 domain-containing protein n=3 Tax=Rhodovulum TaxID=34008 RepID=A0ABX9DCK2_9RHOB|nr:MULTISPECIES: DUF1269 domain-containing protein [Rhodovulum]PTW43790.1 putative membrane protein [Rhodovulum kholense]RAP40050.1 hypothetical protein BYZ73_17340 [Rhodovulum viride]RBO53630.1 DUF1269 domain-containing protein [Rhodovulum sp. BSW8]TDX28824.1 putative membrane protein [Rhodovulum visakhapatnamense]